MEINWAALSAIASFTGICIGISYKDPHASARLLRPVLTWSYRILLVVAIGAAIGITYYKSELKTILKPEEFEKLSMDKLGMNAKLTIILLSPIALQGLELLLQWIEGVSKSIEEEKALKKSSESNKH